ncbi:hypothetical protein CWS72_00085 [Telmatospirillum siberiense]|uniref:Uncharacterized protein n=1 Tax=Telmatospirillum siberiense TaxID=382514 RepID=A0A2N3Q0W8_9PROT|nr:hypothetical protein CWS72_00085 [Telmatospirillum siberiense]
MVWPIEGPRHRWREAKGFGETRPAIEGSVIGTDHRDLLLSVPFRFGGPRFSLSPSSVDCSTAEGDPAET